MKIQHYLFTILTGLGGIFLTSPSLANYYIPQNATGYVGYYTMPSNFYNLVKSGERVHQTGFGINRTDCSSFENVNSTQKGFIEEVPYQAGIYGFKFKNTNNSTNSGYIIAAPNATWDYALNPNQGGQSNYTSHSIINSKLSGALPSGMLERGPLCFITQLPDHLAGWRILEQLSIHISGFHLYVVGNLEPGNYVISNGFAMSKNVGNFSGGNVNNYQSVNSATGGTIEVLKTCDITPTTSTNITFANQLTKIYPTATLLESIQSGITFNCNQNGLSSIFLRPHTPLGASNTGMPLIPGKSTTTIAPYIVTSLNTVARDNALCADNSPNALKYFNKNDHKVVTAGQQNLLSYYFNLCAKGDIKPDIYTGSMDVQIMVQ